MKSQIGLVLAGIYVVIAVFFVATQGLFGESFIAIILGLPWTLGLAAIEFGGADGLLLYVLIILPMVANALILYWFGSLIQKSGKNK